MAALPSGVNKRWDPRTWAGFVPNGMGQVKPNHYLEMLRVAWRNRRHPVYATRVLRDGVCDGCALGTTGLRDFTMDGVHLCMVRLELLELNTADALDERALANVRGLQHESSTRLRKRGRLAHPMVRHRRQDGFKRITWQAANDLLVHRMRQTPPDRAAFYLTSRGLTNENYYACQKAVRAYGTNNVDNSSRICHAPSTTALKATLGVAATTCSYTDWIGSDLIVFFGSDVPNNQPVTTKYLYYAKKAGTKVLVVNPYREPGLDRYWVPSVLESALFGTKIADDWFAVHTGGDIAFVLGVLKALVEIDGVDTQFIEDHTTGWSQVRARFEQASWTELETASGSTRSDMTRFASVYAASRHAVFVWSMGITQHVFGVQNVQAIVDLALARGNVGRPHAGLMPIRGHSGVQGGAEMGAVPNALPGGASLEDAGERSRVEALWGFSLPEAPGLDAVTVIDAAHDGAIDILWSVGGNWLDTLPEPDYVAAALARVPFRVHQDIVLTPQMLMDPAQTVLLLPATTRYEMPGGGTETSTERRVYFSPEIPGKRVGQARAEWEVMRDVVSRVRPDRAGALAFADTTAIRAEIANAAPQYDGIQHLKAKGDAFQWGGPHLCADAAFPTADGRARFVDVAVPATDVPEGWFRLSTRRGKQFNSMVHKRRDPLTGADRDHVLMAAEDAQAMGLVDGARVVLANDAGRLDVRTKIAAVRPGNLQVHWPEGNVLVARGRRDPACGIPDYNALVEVLRP